MAVYFIRKFENQLNLNFRETTSQKQTRLQAILLTNDASIIYTTSLVSSYILAAAVRFPTYYNVFQPAHSIRKYTSEG